MNMAEPIVSQTTFENLSSLADRMISRSVLKDSLIIPMIGAGASIVAEIPSGEDLKNYIYNHLVEGCNAFENPISELLDQEAEHLFGEKAKGGIKKLSLFEFASVVSKFSYGRKIIHEVVAGKIKNPQKKPLTYELLAHLSKHHFIDHFISLNFDELLDNSLNDEIPNRLRIIAGADDLPGANYEEKSQRKFCYLLKPFGSFHKDKYKLKPEDVLQFGDDSLWQFCLNNIFTRPYGNKFPDVTLVLIGYSASELAFEELCRKLNLRDRTIYIYLIKKNKDLGERFEYLQKKLGLIINPIVLDVEVALNILSIMIRKKLKKKLPNAPTVSISRHEIISNCVDYKDAMFDDSRFEIEVILQAVKSRGFFTIESIGDIKRIRNFSKNANKVIASMINENLLIHNIPFEHNPNPKSCMDENRWSQDFNLNMDNPLDFSVDLLTKWNKNPDKEINDWDVCLDKNEVKPNKTTLKSYLEKRLIDIGEGVEIEISSRIDPSSRWLFRKPKEINSISQLADKTVKMFEKLLKDSSGCIHIFGIWSSGEWLFHEKGYAYNEFGKEILKRLKEKSARLIMITSHPDTNILKSIKKDRSNEVISTLKSINNGTVEIGLISWWRLNRRMTLLELGCNTDTHQQEGIYFRRRLYSPLVSPIFLNDIEDCEVLYKIFCHYNRKAVNGNTYYK